MGRSTRWTAPVTSRTAVPPRPGVRWQGDRDWTSDNRGCAWSVQIRQSVAPPAHTSPYPHIVSSRWFTVRCVFRMERLKQIDGLQDTYAYEERMTLWQAESFDDAISLAEAEGREYCDVLPPAEYLRIAQAYELPDPPPTALKSSPSFGVPARTPDLRRSVLRYGRGAPGPRRVERRGPDRRDPVDCFGGEDRPARLDVVAPIDAQQYANASSDPYRTGVWGRS
jgi:hypothetical protein